MEALPIKYARGVCEYCMKKATLQCGRCKRTYYCSADCQRRKWKEHKRYCGTDILPDEAVKMLVHLRTCLIQHRITEKYSGILLAGKFVPRVIILDYNADNRGTATVRARGLSTKSKTRSRRQEIYNESEARMRRWARHLLDEIHKDHILLLWQDLGLILPVEYSLAEERPVAVLF